MHSNAPQRGLALANELVADGRSAFTFDEVEKRLGKSKSATANLLKRMEKTGLIDRVRRGHYVVRQLGVLGTPAAAEDVALSVGAALPGVLHRIAYRSALYEHDLVVHPARSIQVAAERRIRTKSLSGRPLRVVIEAPEKLEVGRGACAVGDVLHFRSASRRTGCCTASAARWWRRGVGRGPRRGRTRAERRSPHGLCPPVGLGGGAATVGLTRRRPGIATAPGCSPASQTHDSGSRSRARNR